MKLLLSPLPLLISIALVSSDRVMAFTLLPTPGNSFSSSAVDASKTATPALPVLDSLDWMCTLNLIDNCVNSESFCSLDDFDAIATKLQDERLALQQRWEQLQDILHPFHRHVTNTRRQQRIAALAASATTNPDASATSFYNSIHANLSMDIQTISMRTQQQQRFLPPPPPTHPIGLFGPDDQTLVYQEELLSSMDSMCMINMAELYLSNSDDNNNEYQDVEMMEAVLTTLEEQRDLVQARLGRLEISFEQNQQQQSKQKLEKDDDDEEEESVSSLLESIYHVLRMEGTPTATQETSKTMMPSSLD